jgi:hypothetical protein|tara:strand:+ start:1239 stop:1466 length:228 start_codon:yes stop_codon:yes gene_type:complete
VGLAMEDTIKLAEFMHEKYLDNCYERDSYNLPIYTETEYQENNKEFLTDLYIAEIEDQSIKTMIKTLQVMSNDKL